MDMNEAISRLKMLAGKPILSNADHVEARKLMRYLKEIGMSNAEISGLTDGRWSESTVKGYTTGVRATEPNPRQDVVNLLNDLMANDLTLNDVRDMLDLRNNLRERETTPEQVSELLNSADAASLNISEMVRVYSQIREQRLSLPNVVTAVHATKVLEKQGLTMDSLPALVESIQKFGGHQEMIEAVSSYASSEALKQETLAVTQQLAEANQALADSHKKLENTKAQQAQFREPIAAYEEVAAMGYSQNSLVALAEVARKYGGPQKVFEAVKAVTGLADIQSQKRKMQAELATIKADHEELRARHSHLNAAITMCQELIEKYNYGLDAMATILSVAEKYGQPLGVLRALDIFGQLTTLKERLQGIEGRIVEREKHLEEIEGRYRESLDELESLNATTLRVGSQVGQIESRLESSRDLRRLIEFLQAPSETEYGSSITLVLFLVATLRTWAHTHQDKFTNMFSIKNSFDILLKELGGC